MRGYRGRSIGLARVVADTDFSDGSAALEILNFHADDRGSLDSTFRLMPLIPNQWRGASQPAALGVVFAMAYVLLYGETPELLFLTSTGVWKYAPWRRAAGGTNPGLSEAQLYTGGGASESVTPQSQPRFPPQVEVVGNRVYFTFCDGAAAYVWDGHRIRVFGYTAPPAPPNAEGPQKKTDDATSPNSGGFSVRGRIGSIEADWTDMALGNIVGGIDTGRWEYRCVYENTDGAYSATSAPGGICTIRIGFGTAYDAGPPIVNAVTPEDLRRRFRVYDIPRGPVGTAAVILLRTRNLDRLPTGDDGSPRFLHRIPGNVASEYIDDIPDGELGPAWMNRDPVPSGFYFLRSFGASMWMMRTDAYPSRVWWSEQENVNGPTPESIMAGHWRDVFPGTGGITGSIVVRLGGGDAAQVAMLVFKERATHWVTGQYPHWTFGTLHAGAGLAGPNLVRACPDGTVVWFGSRTFWQLRPDGSVVDIGQPIRRRLARVNHVFAHMGTSYLDVRRGEVVYQLPLDDAERPDFGFAYDYRIGGFRFLDGLLLDCAIELPGADLVLGAGTFNSVRTVWALGRGYPGYAITAPTARYRSGWSSFEEFGPGLHNTGHARVAVFTVTDRGEQTAALSTLRDWNLDDATDVGTLSGSHPDSATTVPFYNPGATNPAEYDVDTWRARRTYTERVPIEEVSATVFGLNVQGTAPLAIINMDVFGPKVSEHGSRSPEVE